MNKSILITWGLGYIGSHTCSVLGQKGYDLIIVDNLSNSEITVLDKLEKIIGKKPLFYQTDLRDFEEVEKIFQNHEIEGVIHFAGLKAVGESCEYPFLYYENNIQASLNLFQLMEKYQVKNLVFSSSATVYDATKNLPPFSEMDAVGTTNPYGTTKLVLEEILKDLANFKGFYVMNLRYFNPIGAHESGLIGENPQGIPNNLLPYIFKVAQGEQEYLKIFGDDYETPDGTGVRDYIHVMDVAEAHLVAYEWLKKKKSLNVHQEQHWTWMFEIFNLGTGIGTSVKEMLDMVQMVTGKEIPSQIVARRSGDIAVSLANPQKAKQILGWEAKRTVLQAIKDAWNFLQ